MCPPRSLSGSTDGCLTQPGAIQRLTPRTDTECTRIIHSCVTTHPGAPWPGLENWEV